jgi:hypothetical protein
MPKPTQTAVRISEPTLSGSTGPLPTWIDDLRHRVARERGVDPDSLQAEVVRVAQEGGRDAIDIRFTTKSQERHD